MKSPNTPNKELENHDPTHNDDMLGSQIRSRRGYAYLALGSFVAGAAFLVLMTGTNIRSSVLSERQIFYIVLFPFAMSCSLVLFGVLKSYGQLKMRRFGFAFEARGPAALFCTVVIGGVYFSGSGAINQVIRVHTSPGSESDHLTGTLILEAGSRRAEPLDSLGEVSFNDIPSEYEGKQVSVLPRIDGFVSQWQTITITGKPLDLMVQVGTSAQSELIGTILGAKHSEEIVAFLEETGAQTKPDSFGRFVIPVHGLPGDKVRLRVKSTKTGKILFDEIESLPGPIDVKVIDK